METTLFCDQSSTEQSNLTEDPFFCNALFWFVRKCIVSEVNKKI